MHAVWSIGTSLTAMILVPTVPASVNGVVCARLIVTSGLLVIVALHYTS